MSTPVPVCLQFSINSSPYSFSYPNGTNRCYIDLYLLTVQNYGANDNPQQYDSTSVVVGGWIASTAGGYAWKITQIISVNDPYITVEIEDEENFCFNIDANSTGGFPSQGDNAIYFQLGPEGTPVFSPLYRNYVNNDTPLISADIISRFNLRNPTRQYVDVIQPSHGFVGGEPIWIDPADGDYKSANNTNAKYIVGVVSSVNIPTPDSFTYKVFGTYYYDIQKFFSALDLSSFNKGDFIYVSTDGLTNYTTTPPTDFAIPIWVYLGLDSNNKQTGILYTTPSLYSGGGGGGGGSTNSVYIIKVTLSSTGTIAGTPFTSRDPSGNDLVANGWTLNILSTTSFSAVYPSSFTGTFTNFRRFVATTSAGTTYNVSNMSVASSTGQTCRFDPTTRTLTFSGFTNAFAGIVTTASTDLYVAFEYIPQTIIF